MEFPHNVLPALAHDPMHRTEPFWGCRWMWVPLAKTTQIKIPIFAWVWPFCVRMPLCVRHCWIKPLCVRHWWIKPLCVRHWWIKRTSALRGRRAVTRCHSFPHTTKPHLYLTVAPMWHNSNQQLSKTTSSIQATMEGHSGR